MITPLLSTSSSWFENVTFNVIDLVYQVLDMHSVPSNTVVYSGLVGHLQNAQFSKEGQADKERNRTSPWILTVTTQYDLQMGQFIVITSVKNAYGMWIASTQPYEQFKVDFLNASLVIQTRKFLDYRVGMLWRILVTLLME